MSTPAVRNIRTRFRRPVTSGDERPTAHMGALGRSRIWGDVAIMRSPSRQTTLADRLILPAQDSLTAGTPAAQLRRSVSMGTGLRTGRPLVVDDKPVSPAGPSDVSRQESPVAGRPPSGFGRRR